VAGKGEGDTAAGSPVKIIAEPRLNALIIIADRLATDRVLQLIQKLATEQGSSGEIQLKLVQLKYTTAKRMASLLTKIFSDQIIAGKGEGKTTKSSPVKIIEEERLNALIIIAGRLEIERILSLIKQLDVFQESGKIQSNFKLYHLQHAVAKDLAVMLKEVTGKITEVARKDVEQKPEEGQQANIADAGTKEIVLTGINVGDFGSNGENFLQLITTLDNIKGIDRFRISSIEPNLLTDDIISFCADSNKFVPHFHIPLQSGSNPILKNMKRRYTTNLYESRVHFIKQLIPDCCIGVDVIVGYPGEENDHFKETKVFLESLDISYLHVFSYSQRKDTLAATMENHVTKEEKELRSKALHILSNEKRHQFYNQFENTVRPVLIEKSNNIITQGFTDNYIKVHIEENISIQNTIVSVLLKKNNGSYMEGEII